MTIIAIDVYRRRLDGREDRKMTSEAEECGIIQTATFYGVKARCCLPASFSHAPRLVKEVHTLGPQL